MEILSYYGAASRQGLRPALLEFRPTGDASLSVCGIAPLTTLEVREGLLLRNGIMVGAALDIFEHLLLPSSNDFFPAFIGFFGYEFASYLGMPCSQKPRTLPDAFFRLYERGLIIRDGQIIHHDPLPGENESIKLSQVSPQDLLPSLSREDFFDALERIKQKIRLGDVYQVNFSLPFYFDAQSLDAANLYDAMRRLNKSPFMGLISHESWSLISGSPERLFSLRDHHISARPIAGTKKRGADRAADEAQMVDLRSCPKELAEHAMLVDLMRNDLNRIAIPASVHVSEDRSVEFYSHVMHLVSEVRAHTFEPLINIMRSIFPGGTITGAPKESVMQCIADLEHVPRGPYTGSLGYISSGYGTDFNILIRSVVKDGDLGITNAGAGIVIDSQPEREWQEVHRKAGALKDILAKNCSPKELRPPVLGQSLPLPKATSNTPLSRVLFIENHDSFSFNIVDALRTLGARVFVSGVSNQELRDFSHIVIGPGPGNPENMPELGILIKRAFDLEIPLLGICLGHQAIGQYFGAKIYGLALPVHGKSHPIHHFKRKLFFGLKEPSLFTRYHSLAIASAPKDFEVDAYSDDDVIMAISHQKRPIYGVQFHPESYLSLEGHLLLNNFLRRATKWPN